MQHAPRIIPVLRAFVASCLFACVIVSFAAAHQAPQDSPEKPAPPLNPAQFELLETRVRFEANGDNRKEVHALVRINSELGVRQFARLNFDYNRSFEAVEIPLVHVTHPSGGTADILPSAITDRPNPVVVNYPAYHDVRAKSVRILGLQPGDLLEYRVITTTTHHPLAPDFWLDHSFERSGIVSKEIFEIDLPTTRPVQLRINPATPANPIETTAGGATLYRWNVKAIQLENSLKESSPPQPDLALTSFASWQQLADRLRNLLKPDGEFTPELSAKADELAKVPTSDPRTASDLRAEAVYTFVSQKIRTVDLPLGSTGFKTRNPSDVLASGYGTPEDKFMLFAALAGSFFGPAQAGLISSSVVDPETSLPRPGSFDHLLTMTGWPSINFLLDLNVEVAPYQVIPLQFRGKNALVVGPAVTELWRKVDDFLPFHARQRVSIDASISPDGNLTAKVHYDLRGDNELLLRLAFHKTPKENWKDIAQLLSLSGSFRGQITSVSASDPYATHDPFTVDYEITTPKFVDLSKKSVQVPALLPQIGLPDPPAKPAAGVKPSPIELGTPLEVTTTMNLHLPPGVSVQAPTGTSVQRDYATFSSQYSASGNSSSQFSDSQYPSSRNSFARNPSSHNSSSRSSSSQHSAKGQTITASRRINFLLRQIPADRAQDFNAFLHAVQYDQSQLFTLIFPIPASPTLSVPAPSTSPRTATPPPQPRP